MQPGVDMMDPIISVASRWFRCIDRLQRETRPASRPCPKAAIVLHRPKLVGLDQPNEFIPFGMRQPHGVRVLTDRDTLVGDLDHGAFCAGGQRAIFIGSILEDLLLDGSH